MVDYKKIAIADCLWHPSYGIVSHQPLLSEKMSENIRVSDINFCVFMVKATDCREATDEEFERYWQIINRRFNA